MSTEKMLLAGLCVLALLFSATLQAQTHDWVYRVDVRPPEMIFAHGFSTTGTDTDLLDHALGAFCAPTESQRSMWISTYHNRDVARGHIQTRLREQQALPSQGLWIYAIHTDDAYLDVTDALRQVLQAALHGEHGYGVEQVNPLRYLLSLPTINLRSEVVTSHLIEPQSIHSGQYYSLAPSSTPTNPVLRIGQSVSNAHYRQPPTPMTNIRADLPRILPPASITLYGEQLANAPDLCALCVEASNTNSSRYRRSALLERLNCPTGPSAAKALIGSEE